MKYKNVEFDAIVAMPTCGKSFLCDKYPDLFVDVDEVRLRCKYVVPENITRAELEATKGCRPFARRANHDYINELYKKLDEAVKAGKTLILAPHLEAIEYLARNSIKYCFVFQGKNMKAEIEKRLKPGGEAYFTVGSKESYWFNNPTCDYIDENTRIRREDGPEDGIPHFYIDENDCFKMFNDFSIIGIKNIRELTHHGTFSAIYHIWLKKKVC